MKRRGTCELDDLLGGVCPRCGERYSYIDARERNGHVYYYAVHYYRDGTGRRRVKKCYLGPREYIYASITHAREGLRFRGLIDPLRIVDYLEAIIGFLEETDIPISRRKDLADRLRRLAELLSREV